MDASWQEACTEVTVLHHGEGCWQSSEGTQHASPRAAQPRPAVVVPGMFSSRPRLAPFPGRRLPAARRSSSACGRGLSRKGAVSPARAARAGARRRALRVDSFATARSRPAERNERRHGSWRILQVAKFCAPAPGRLQAPGSTPSTPVPRLCRHRRRSHVVLFLALNPFLFRPHLASFLSPRLPHGSIRPPTFARGSQGAKGGGRPRPNWTKASGCRHHRGLSSLCVRPARIPRSRRRLAPLADGHAGHGNALIRWELLLLMAFCRLPGHRHMQSHLLSLGHIPRRICILHT